MATKIEQLKKGQYEHTNLVKLVPETGVPDTNVFRSTPYRGVVTTQGDVIEADYINTLAQAGVWWTQLTVDTTTTVVDRYTASLQVEGGLFEGLKLKTIVPVTNSHNPVEITVGNVDVPVKKSTNGALVTLPGTDLSGNKLYTFVYTGGYFVMEQDTLASTTSPGVITEKRVVELAISEVTRLLATWCPIPVAGIYLSMDTQNPNTLWPGTTWNRISQGKTLVGLDTTDTDFNTLAKIGGLKNVTLTEAQMPAHVHNASSDSHSHGVDVQGNHFHNVDNHTHIVPDHAHGLFVHGGTGTLTSEGTYLDTQGWQFQSGAYSVKAYTSGGSCITQGSAPNTNVAGAHSHNISTHTHSHQIFAMGGGQAHTNLQPYFVVNIWQRIS